MSVFPFLAVDPESALQSTATALVVLLGWPLPSLGRWRSHRTISI